MNPLPLIKNSVKFVRRFSAESKLNIVKPFEEIPGPVGPFGVGTLYKYLPVIGNVMHLTNRHTQLNIV